MTIEVKQHTHFYDSSFGEFGVLDERVDDRRQQQRLLPRQGEDSLRRHCSPVSAQTGKCYKSRRPLCYHFTSSTGTLLSRFSPYHTIIRATATTEQRERNQSSVCRLHLQRGRRGVRVRALWGVFLQPAGGFASISAICGHLL